MTGELEAVITALECLDLSEMLHDPMLFEVGVEERRNLIGHLQTIDMTAVPDEARARLRPRLEQVIARDAQLLAHVQKARDEVAVAVERLVSGRAMVRGYGASVSDGEATMKRVG